LTLVAPVEVLKLAEMLKSFGWTGAPVVFCHGLPQPAEVERRFSPTTFTA
jgi:hypothetical protein